MAWLGLDQLLLWRFLNVMPIWAYVAGGALLLGLCVATLRVTRGFEGPGHRTLLLCVAAAVLLMLLGGQGRIFYANVDWQVRFAVLRDMSIHPWPFAYLARGTPEILRAPVGMFMAPALVAQAWGLRAGDFALLVQNSLLLGACLALAATLFSSVRARLVALGCWVAFSGLDAIGRLIVSHRLSDHLEGWASLQFSSTLTLAFWVPQHAMSGWIGAVAYLLWRAEKIPLAAFLALLPLTALWSPLGLMGAMPFAALAAVQTLWARKLRPVEIGLPAVASLLCLPGLLYLGAANDSVGMRLMPLPPLQWGLFELLELLVYLVPLALLPRLRFGRDTLALLGLWLLAIPFVQIGWSIDFMMRASISALTILAVMVADAIAQRERPWRWLLLMLTIGSVTGLHEVRRALSHPPAPQVRCSIFKAWNQSFSDFPIHTYAAPLAAVPAPVRPPQPTLIPAAEPARCWDGHWYSPAEASG